MHVVTTNFRSFRIKQEIRNKFNFCIYNKEWVQSLYFITKRKTSTPLTQSLACNLMEGWNSLNLNQV